jgi:hypothetical protein
MSFGIGSGSRRSRATASVDQRRTLSIDPATRDMADLEARVGSSTALWMARLNTLPACPIR